MKAVFSTAFAALLATSLVCAESFAKSFTEKNAAKAAEVIERAVAAHGGSRGLDALDTLVIEHRTINHAVDQSVGTDAPWDRNENTGYDAIDLGDSIYANLNEFNGGGFQGVNRTIINGEDSYQVDLRAGTVSRIAEPDFATTSGPFVRVTPALLVRTLQQRAGNAHYLGQTTIDGVEYDVIGFSMTVGPAISLYFDRKDGLLRRSERILPGIGQVRYDFGDYRAVDGMPFNRTFQLHLNEELNVERTLVSTKVNEPLDDVLALDDGLAELPETTPDVLARHDIAEGVWLIGGTGTYAMFVDMGDYVFAAGGTAGIPDRIRLLREVVGDKPIRYGMLTHHHFDHVMGVSAYEAEGATVLAAGAHEAIARRAAADGKALKFQAIDGRATFESGGRVIEVIDIGPTAHTAHLTVAWLPREGILFEADHFTLPPVGPVTPAVESTRSFAEALAKHGIRPRQIVSAHSPRLATMDDLRAALEAELFQARR